MYSLLETLYGLSRAPGALVQFHERADGKAAAGDGHPWWPCSS
ncbi:hypothetical protein SELR_pSRC900040 (plasmid) [Selenomonas ruminantium subsp. lactilytica TAM6421]|uniref:Uncharacterized protein n=1 Tax=Selenomonas ruminantium subsp. lactilytica (strain NBRC 103574 / TAM6421) TaxID=927704 RepID=I0GVM0_SELRL|nr:hypothetical protein SELR_pSRC900040 [Selenomonas ruminantium subsp. lactilytica TAM6421]